MKLAKMPDGTVEIYDAVQGEGFSMGIPMAFVRLSLCNLQCTFCDTSYTWLFTGSKAKHLYSKPVDPKEYQMDMSVEEVADYIDKVAGHHKRAVFTGGEPTLQQKDIIKVIKILRARSSDWYFEIETNGSFTMDEELGLLLSQINSSPKLESSGNSKAMRDKPEAINRLLDLHRQGKPLCFKFVVFMENWEKDMEEIKLWEEKYNVPRELIYLMPEGITRDRITKATEFLNEIGQRQDYRVSTRLQVLVYGDRRAV